VRAWPAWVLLLEFVAPAGAQSLRIYHIDVDQGGATLFVAPGGSSLLVDTGRNGHGDRIRTVMADAGISQIDHLVITHYHDDHYGAADELVVEQPPITVVNVYDRGDKAFLPSAKLSAPRFTEYQTALGHRARHLMRGETIALDPSMVVMCVASGSVVLGETQVQHGGDENDMSVALLIQYGDFRYFAGGDIEAHTEDKIAALDLVTDVDVYQADHHGSDTSSSPNFLADLAPSLIIVSNGDRADYRHPKQSTLNAFLGVTPTPTVIQTNQYTKGGDGGNVPSGFIADLVPNDSDGTVLITVSANGAYSAQYRSMTRTFQSKPRTSLQAPAVRIVSLLPDPTGSDRDLEAVTIRNDHSVDIDLTGWLLRDLTARVWSLSSLGALSPGEEARIVRNGMAMSLDNEGDTIELVNAAGAIAHRVTYGPTATAAIVLVTQ
jgi:competence protein ComEC